MKGGKAFWKWSQNYVFVWRWTWETLCELKLNEKQKFAVSLTFWLPTFALAGPRTCGHGDVGDPGCDMCPKRKSHHSVLLLGFAGFQQHLMVLLSRLTCHVNYIHVDLMWSGPTVLCQQWCLEPWVSVFPCLLSVSRWTTVWTSCWE